MPIYLLAILNDDPSYNAGARLRIQNWAQLVPRDSALQITLAQRPERMLGFFKLVRCWLRKSSASCRPSLPSEARHILLFQKPLSLEMVALMLYLRLSGVAVIHDVCDPPIKVFNPFPFSKHFLAFCYLVVSSRYLLDGITVSSSVLRRSFSSSVCPVSYIPDCTDAASESRHHPAVVPVSVFRAASTRSGLEHVPRRPLRLLWFGGAARVKSSSGIEELYMAKPFLEKLGHSFELFLDVCTILDDSTMPIFQAWASESDFMIVSYYQWSLAVQEVLLGDCDFCFLPRFNSLATFYKSPNRVILAAAHGRRTISNTIASDDFEGLGVLMASEIVDLSPNDLLKLRDACPPSLPEVWQAGNIVTKWEKAITDACRHRQAAGRPSLLGRIGLSVTLGGLLFLLLLRETAKFLKNQLRQRRLAPSGSGPA